MVINYNHLLKVYNMIIVSFFDKLTSFFVIEYSFETFFFLILSDHEENHYSFGGNGSQILCQATCRLLSFLSL